MLNEICAWLKNWFEKDHYFGTFTISGGSLLGMSDKLLEGQYFRIIGSVFNDGIYQYPTMDLADETFDGAVWALAIPKDLTLLSQEIEAWMAEYGGVGSFLMSPFASESFAGYSRSKASGGVSSSESNAEPPWASVFGGRLARWRKL